MPEKKLLDLTSHATVVVTLALFIIALFVKGFTHDLLLEAGVFLVSAKLVIMGHKTSLATDELRNELKQIRALLENPGKGAV